MHTASNTSVRDAFATLITGFYMLLRHFNRVQYSFIPILPSQWAYRPRSHRHVIAWLADATRGHGRVWAPDKQALDQLWWEGFVWGEGSTDNPYRLSLRGWQVALFHLNRENAYQD